MNYLQQKRNRFYYFIVTDLNKIRDDKMSILFDEDTITTFLSEYDKFNFKTTSEIHLARFWKDERSAIKTSEEFTRMENKRGNKVIFKLQSMSRQEFLKTIPDLENESSYVYLKNKKHKESEKEYLEDLTEFRSQYKAIDAYIQVDQPSAWLNCPDCGLKPIIWTFNNGERTACGCGEHHSINSESIMSHVSRNGGSAMGYDYDGLRKNWNHWCKTGEILFTPNVERW